jgi:hypothetical protein
MGDSAYGSAEMLGWLVYEHGIEPHVTVFDKSERQDGTFSRADFTYDDASDVYVCPSGKLLTTTGSLIDAATLRYRASRGGGSPYRSTKGAQARRLGGITSRRATIELQDGGPGKTFLKTNRPKCLSGEKLNPVNRL